MAPDRVVPPCAATDTRADGRAVDGILRPLHVDWPARYTADYDEVKAKGALTNSTRTAEQTDIAYFWTDNFAVQWNRAIREIALQHVPHIGDRARLFALANLAGADALITAWDSKKHYFFWRPVTAIRNGELDGNPDTIGDSEWQSLVNNPNYPDYTSGANNITGAMSRTLALFFGTDQMTFQLTSLAPLAVKKTRTYTRFSAAAQQCVNARVYLGIHFRFADSAARTPLARTVSSLNSSTITSCCRWSIDRQDLNQSP